MASRKDQVAFDESLKFFGVISASLSHQINNVFAIINELAGLMDDFLLVAEGGQELDPEKQREILKKIAFQAGRGIDYVKQLNTFAHTTDEADEITDGNDCFNKITTLCGRFAKLRSLELKITPPDRDVKLRISPFMLQHAIFRSIEIGLLVSQRGDSLEVLMEGVADGARLRVRSEREFEETQELKDKCSFLALLVERLGGKLESVPLQGKHIEIALVLPAEKESNKDG